MPKVNVSEAARLAGITRQYLHKKYIKPGIITVERDHAGNPQIDTAEILRIFGKLQDTLGDSKHDSTTYREMTAINDSKNAALQTEVEALREALKGAAARETWLQGKVDELTAQVAAAHRLLEHTASAASPPQEPKRGFFVRLFGK